MAQIGKTSAYDSSSNSNLNTHRASGMSAVGDTGSNLAVTSTNIEVHSNGMKIGFVQSFTPSESRTINKLQAIGWEGVVQSVPGNTNGGQLTVSRFAVYNNNFFNAMGATQSGSFVEKGAFSSMPNNPFKTLKDQRVPLEFKVITKLPVASDKVGYYTETYVDCWLSSYSKTIAANTITITEQATVQYSDVSAIYS